MLKTILEITFCDTFYSSQLQARPTSMPPLPEKYSISVNLSQVTSCSLLQEAEASSGKTEEKITCLTLVMIDHK